MPGIPVRYAPGAPANYFFCAGRYYVFASGVWHVSAGYNGPWVAVAPEYGPGRSWPFRCGITARHCGRGDRG